MRISDWSSDVCSSDHSRGSTDKREKRQMKWNKFIRQVHRWLSILFTLIVAAIFLTLGLGRAPAEWVYFLPLAPLALMLDRKSVVTGKRVSVRVGLGGRRIIKKKK